MDGPGRITEKKIHLAFNNRAGMNVKLGVERI